MAFKLNGEEGLNVQSNINDIWQAISYLTVEAQSLNAEIITKMTIELKRSQIASRTKKIAKLVLH